MLQCPEAFKHSFALLLEFCDVDLFKQPKGPGDLEHLARETVCMLAVVLLISSWYLLPREDEEFQLALFTTNKKESLFADWIFDLFDTNHKGILGFEDFAHALLVFHPNASINDKIEWTSRLHSPGYSRLLDFNRAFNVKYSGESSMKEAAGTLVSTWHFYTNRSCKIIAFHINRPRHVGSLEMRI